MISFSLVPLCWCDSILTYCLISRDHYTSRSGRWWWPVVQSVSDSRRCSYVPDNRWWSGVAQSERNDVPVALGAWLLDPNRKRGFCWLRKTCWRGANRQWYPNLPLGSPFPPTFFPIYEWFARFRRATHITDHGESEQFHSEYKTNLDMERLPSGIFSTNALIMLLGMVAFNIIRICGQESLNAIVHLEQAGDPLPINRRSAVFRRRIRAVLLDIMYLASHVTSSSRYNWISCGRCCPWSGVFKWLYQKFLAPDLVPDGWLVDRP